MFEWFIELLQENQLLAAGVGTTIVGWLTYQIREIPAALQRHAKYQFTTTLDLTDRERTFVSLKYWLAERGRTRKLRHVSLTTHNEYDEDRRMEWYGYSPGRHMLWVNRRPVLLHLTRRHKEDGVYRGGYTEQISLTTIGRDSRVWVTLLEQAKARMKEATKFDRIPIYLSLIHI